MTQLDQKIHVARRRLWLCIWLNVFFWLIAVAAAALAAVVLVQRLFDLPLPLGAIVTLLGSLALAVSIGWSLAKRPTPARAAAALDQAAGLEERLSSGHYCRDTQEAFGQAVVADAERLSGSISPRRHIRLSMPEPVPWSILAVLVASLACLVPAGLLRHSEAQQAATQSEEVEQARAVVKKEMDAVRKMADTVPALADLSDELDGLDRKAGGRLERPADVRYEAVKRIDNLADAIKNKRDSRKYDAGTEMRKMLRGLEVPDSADASTQKLAKSLQAGDFKTAKEEIQSLREQLATLKHDEDKELVAKISRQLDDLAKQLEKLAKNEQLDQRLRQAGLEKKDLDRLLRNLKKEDIEQLKKTLQEKGLNQREIQKVVNQLQRRKTAGGMTQKLAQGLKQAAQSGTAGQTGDAAAGLSAAAEQLSELELLEQEMNQLDAALADLQNTRNAIDRPCPYCQGRGCSRCQGGRGGMGRMGHGRGGLAPEEQTAVDFKTERGKVHTGKGAIIGQFLVEGEQIKGDVSRDVAEVIAAAEHDATDRINRSRLPRQYHQAVKAYFSSVRRSIKGGDLTGEREDPSSMDDKTRDAPNAEPPREPDQP